MTNWKLLESAPAEVFIQVRSPSKRHIKKWNVAIAISSRDRSKWFKKWILEDRLVPLHFIPTEWTELRTSTTSTEDSERRR